MPARVAQSLVRLFLFIGATMTKEERREKLKYIESAKDEFAMQVRLLEIENEFKKAGIVFCNLIDYLKS
jgi:hypothetical protein